MIDVAALVNMDRAVICAFGNLPDADSERMRAAIEDLRTEYTKLSLAIAVMKRQARQEES